MIGPWRVLRAAVLALIGLLLLPYLITPLYLVVDPASTLMLWRKMTGRPVEQIWVPISAISPALPLAVITAEDNRYCKHNGVDFQEIKNALDEADEISEARGVSTLSQQAAKNLFLWPGRSILRKGLEAPLAMWLDLVLGKRRLMEIYLNVAEWGPEGQFGAEAGARRAFRKSARDLTPREAALLAASLPNPVRRVAAQPGAGLRRLGALYERRMTSSGNLDSCVRAG